MPIFDRLIWWRKKEKLELSPDRYEIVFSNEATEQGVFDDNNKIIRIFKGGQFVREEQFTRAGLNAIKKVHRLPGWDFTRQEEEQFDFENISTFGEVRETRG